VFDEERLTLCGVSRFRGSILTGLGLDRECGREGYRDDQHFDETHVHNGPSGVM
jgi:hypothetical protein